MSDHIIIKPVSAQIMFIPKSMDESIEAIKLQKIEFKFNDIEKPLFVVGNDAVETLQEALETAVARMIVSMEINNVAEFLIATHAKVEVPFIKIERIIKSESDVSSISNIPLFVIDGKFMIGAFIASALMDKINERLQHEPI